MVLTVLFVVVSVLVVLFLLAVFPPRNAHGWRHATRPLRRAVRPGHYRW